jgi:hypothetical protein
MEREGRKRSPYTQASGASRGSENHLLSEGEAASPRWAGRERQARTTPTVRPKTAVAEQQI